MFQLSSYLAVKYTSKCLCACYCIIPLLSGKLHFVPGTTLWRAVSWRLSIVTALLPFSPYNQVLLLHPTTRTTIKPPKQTRVAMKASPPASSKTAGSCFSSLTLHASFFLSPCISLFPAVNSSNRALANYGYHCTPGAQFWGVGATVTYCSLSQIPQIHKAPRSPLR